MNKWEKEVQQSLLSSEADALKELERQYKTSMKSVMDKIKVFDADIKMIDNALLEEGLDEAAKTKLLSMRQSKVYQKQYQQALQSQISGILDNLQGQNYSTIEGYLRRSYEDAYVGTMYDIAKQGIPIITPIDQAQVTKAVLLDSKISTKKNTKVGALYDALGVDSLKKKITQEVSRGIATGLSYADMARNLDNAAGTGYSNASRIVRTEGHRIQQAATNDAQHSAKAKGADVVKQWDAALDGRTRPTHRQLDGQIREIDEPFEVGGTKVDRPGYFGDPAEDCNCRCACTTRARWALDDDELETLKERAAYYGLDKTQDFDDYKKKYLKASQNVASQATQTGVKSDTFKEVDTPSSDSLKSKGIDYNKVTQHDSPKEDSEVISLVAGGDKTSGSCASAALAYAGQKQGLNVLDFRGGGSMDWFASKLNKVKMFQDLGVDSLVESSAKSNLTNGKRILDKIEKGKQYYLSVGRHAAVVRLNADDVLQYLELQSSAANGWKDFGGDVRDTLKYRFGCTSSSAYYADAYATDISQLKGDKFRTILGYINTNTSEQRKGASGTIK